MTLLTVDAVFRMWTWLLVSFSIRWFLYWGNFYIGVPLVGLFFTKRAFQKFYIYSLYCILWYLENYFPYTFIQTNLKMTNIQIQFHVPVKSQDVLGLKHFWSIRTILQNSYGIILSSTYVFKIRYKIKNNWISLNKVI